MSGRTPNADRLMGEPMQGTASDALSTYSAAAARRTRQPRLSDGHSSTRCGYAVGRGGQNRIGQASKFLALVEAGLSRRPYPRTKG